MDTHIAPAYQRAKTFALVQQAIVLFLSALILDGGDVFHTCLGALAAFWIGAAIIGVRRPQTPTRLDLALIRFGYIPLCILAYLSTQFVWRLRGL
jgi:hypothetical protein